MSTVPPPAPPLNLINNFAITTPSKFRKHNINECAWASNYPDIQQSCYLAQICTISPPIACWFMNIPSIIQDGPTCGLTAISMLLKGNPDPEKILNIAKTKLFTNNGEMFSTRNLYDLLCDILYEKNKIDEKNIQCQLYEGQLNCAKVKEYLKGGACLLVPYDPDFNHAPCIKMGHKAHWALLIGYLIDQNNHFFVLSRHGKTKNIAVWSLKSLSDSNNNLNEFAQPKGYPNMDFLLPEGGIGGKNGLKNFSVIVVGVDADNVQII